jgi:putative transposase
MSYRTVEIAYRPHSSLQWQTYTACRTEAARLWNDLVERHFRIRRRHLSWPSKARWQRWATGKYPGLSAQSVQQIIGEFCEAVHSCRQLRKIDPNAKYPWRKMRFRDVVYTNQDARLRSGYLVLPNGTSGTLRVHVSDAVILPGRLMEVRLGLFVVQIVCEVPDEARGSGPTLGVDLGVNTLIAATDGQTAVLVSGRQVKSIVQGRNKALASFVQAQSRKVKGSRQWKRLQRKKKRMLAKARRRVRDACHKATRQIANAFPGARCYVGKPFNEAAQRIGRVQAQMVSQACNAKLIFMLDYKSAGAIEIEEHYTSQSCFGCGNRSRQRRTYRCSCGVTAPRDVIGAVNIRTKGLFGIIQTGQVLPPILKYLRPLGRNSSSGHLASCSV